MATDKKTILTKTLGMFFLLTIIVLSMNMVSAVKIDYTANAEGVADMEAHIEDTILFGLIQVGEQGTMELKSHKSPTEVLDVGLGWQVDMYYDTNFGKAQAGALGDVTFIDMRTGKEVEREWKFVYWGTEEYEEPIYSCSDLTLKNGTINQECVQSGTETKTRETWLDYNSRDLPKGQIRIGVMVNNKYGDYIDGIWEVQDKKIDRHASWQSSWETNMKAWYDLDEPSGSLIDNHSTNDGTNSGGTQGVTGKLGQAIDLSGSGSQYAYLPDLNLGNDFTIGFWFYKDSFSAGDSNGVVLSQWNDNGGSNERSWNILIQSSVVQFSVSSSGSNEPGNDVTASGLTINEDQWYFIVATKSGTNGTLYIGGVPVKSDVLSSAVYNSAENVNIARALWGGADRYTSARPDTIFFLTRAMSDTEILNIYNGDFGCAYQYCISVAPDVTLIYPENESTFNNQNLTLSGNVSSDTLENVTAIIDGVYNETNSSGIAGVYNFSKIFSEGTHTWNYEACDLTDCANGTERTFTIDTTPFIEFLTPPTLPDYSNITDETIPIGVNVSTLYYFNISYDLYNTNGTHFNQYYENETFEYNFTNIPDGHYHYNVTTCTTTGRCNVTETRHINHDVTPPSINVTSPNGTYPYLENGESVDLNYTIVDDLIGLDMCWVIYNEITTYLNCSDNSTINYVTGQNNLTIYANDTLGNENNLFVNWSVVVNSYTQGADHQIVGEGTDVVFNLSVDYSLSHTATAEFHLNGNTYSPDTILTTPGNNFYEVTINIPDGFGNSTGKVTDWYWIYNITSYSTYINTTTQNITIYSVEIDDCSLYTDVILNMSLQDEKTLVPLPDVNDTSQVEIDLTITGLDNTSIMWEFSNTYNNETNPIVCIPNNILNYSSYRIDFTISFDSTDHVTEFYYLDNGTLDSTNYFNSYTTHNIGLYDLLTTDSTTFLFNFYDVDGLPVDNAIVHTFRRYIGDGEFIEVERSKQDDNGDTHVHLVEEDVIYYFMITQYGNIIYISTNYNALCESVPCTITLTETGEFNELPTDYSLINGSSYIVDNKTTRTSTYYYQMTDIGTMEFVLYKQEFNGTISQIDSASSTSTAGSLSVDIPLHAGNVSYFTAVYKNGGFIESQWVDLEDGDGTDYLGTALSVFIGFLIILTLVLIAVTGNKIGVVVSFIAGLIFTGVLGLIRLRSATGFGLVIYIVLAGGILIYKLTKK